MNNTTTTLATLESYVIQLRTVTPETPGGLVEDLKKQILATHKALLKLLHKTTKKGQYVNDPPEWERFPIGRDEFVQRVA